MRKSIIIMSILTILSVYSTLLWADDSRPRALKAVSGDGVVYLSWSPPRNEVTGYWVYRSIPHGECRLVSPKPINKTFYKDTDVTTGQSYRYIITAIDSDGNESSQSKNIKVTPNARSGTLCGY